MENEEKKDLEKSRRKVIKMLEEAKEEAETFKEKENIKRIKRLLRFGY